MKKFKEFIVEKKELFFIMNKDGDLYSTKGWVRDKKKALSYKSFKDAKDSMFKIKPDIIARNMEVIPDSELE